MARRKRRPWRTLRPFSYLLGVAAAATSTPLARIALEFVRNQYPGRQALLFAEGQASSAGSALYGGWLIDALDAHDGHVLTKGHAGVAILPGLLSLPETQGLSGRRFLGELAIGYEIAIRAGISLHGSARDSIPPVRGTAWAWPP